MNTENFTQDEILTPIAQGKLTDEVSAKLKAVASEVAARYN